MTRPARSGWLASMPVSRTAIVALPVIGTFAYARSHWIFGRAHCWAYEGSLGSPALLSITALAACSTVERCANAARIRSAAPAGTVMTRVRSCAKVRAVDPPEPRTLDSMSAALAELLNFTRRETVGPLVPGGDPTWSL